MEEERLLLERCASLSDLELVRNLTLSRADNSAAFADEALREFARRGTSMEACINRVRVHAGETRSGETDIDTALALVTDGVPRRAVASFTHCLGETLVVQREGWGWVLHAYAEDRYEHSYLIDNTASARRALEDFLRLQPWREGAGAGHHLDDWQTLASSEDATHVLTLSDRLTLAGVPHIVRPTLFTAPGDNAAALLVPRRHKAAAAAVINAGQVSVQQLRRQAQAADAAADAAAELAAYDELVKVDGDNHAVHYNRGVLLLEAERHEDAAAAFMEAAICGMNKVKPDLSLDQGSTGGGLLGLAGVGARLVGRAVSPATGPGYPDWFDDVELRLQALLHRLGPRVDVLHSLASMDRFKGDNVAAAERYQQILLLVPGDEVARFQLEYLAAAGD
ncbi:MAG: hypothetical protein O2782_01165 [bacterium]|nr:hypothetical protein [bacterium]